jgi:hypothetical protein
MADIETIPGLISRAIILCLLLVETFGPHPSVILSCKKIGCHPERAQRVEGPAFCGSGERLRDHEPDNTKSLGQIPGERQDQLHPHGRNHFI